MFLLFLIGLGTANIKAQVRIGGDGAPNRAAVLDLNADDSVTPSANKGAVALPRISLATTTAQLNGVTPIIGMLVYNTNSSVIGGSGTGLYYFDGTRWLRVEVNTTSTPIISLALVLDTSLTVTAPANGPYQLSFTSPNTLPNDLCSSSWGWAMAKTAQVYIAYQIGNAGAGNQARVICYRAV